MQVLQGTWAQETELELHGKKDHCTVGHQISGFEGKKNVGDI
jgi:hypothetical protein